jgi:integrase
VVARLSTAQTAVAGQIRKRGDRRWLIRVYLGRDSATGARKWLSKTVHGSPGRTGGVRYVRRSLSRVGARWRFEEPKTARARRSVPLSAQLVSALRHHRRAVLKQRLRAGSEWQELGLVFCSEVGTPVDLSNLRNRSFKRILRRAGLPADLRPYDLRHSAATLLLLAGEHPKVVSERLGHSTVALTLDTYSHALPTLQQQATEKIASVLYGDREP